MSFKGVILEESSFLRESIVIGLYRGDWLKVSYRGWALKDNTDVEGVERDCKGPRRLCRRDDGN